MNYEELKKQAAIYRQIKQVTTNTKNQLVVLKAAFVISVKKCEKCGREEFLTLDHIVPISILEQLGFNELQDNDENWQVLCRPCNSYKANRLDFTNYKTKEVLLKYISKL